MRRFGLIGYPLSHSFSKAYFEKKFLDEEIADCSYELYPLLAIEELKLLIQKESNLAGLNVTIPFKESVISLLDKTDAAAREIGAVNCIKISDLRLTGYNTDAGAFEKSLLKFLKSKPDLAFVLGTGGSSKAVCYVLNKLSIPFVRVSRNAGDEKITYPAIADYFQTSNLFINASPVGMYPVVNDCPDIPYHRLTAKDFLFDLVYNPERSLFLSKGKQQGAQIKNGLEMLIEQAESSWKIWNDERI